MNRFAISHAVCAVVCSLLLACSVGLQQKQSTDVRTPRDLKEYEVVWHKEGEHNQTSTGHFRYDYEVKEFFGSGTDTVVKIVRIEPNGDRTFICDIREGISCP